MARSPDTPSTNAKRRSEKVSGIASLIGTQSTCVSGVTLQGEDCQRPELRETMPRMSREGMSAQKYTILQICIICFLVFLVGTKALVRRPEWLNGEEHNKLHANFNRDNNGTTPRERFITLASSTTSFRYFRQIPAWTFTLRRLVPAGL
jgi:hypothetical protein